jgi:hypothetical protein
MYKLKHRLSVKERRKRADAQRYSTFGRLPGWVIIAGAVAVIACAVVYIGRMLIPG